MSLMRRSRLGAMTRARQGVGVGVRVPAPATNTLKGSTKAAAEPEPAVTAGRFKSWVPLGALTARFKVMSVVPPGRLPTFQVTRFPLTEDGARLEEMKLVPAGRFSVITVPWAGPLGAFIWMTTERVLMAEVGLQLPPQGLKTCTRLFSASVRNKLPQLSRAGPPKPPVDCPRPVPSPPSCPRKLPLVSKICTLL